MKFKLLLVFSLISQMLVAQTINVVGKVTDGTTSETLIGATVSIKGTSKATFTDTNGEFTIAAQVGDTLAVNYIGYTAITLVVKTELNNISMTAITKQIDEVVVVGYTTQKKSDLTGSVGIVNMEQMGKVPYANVLQNLQGRLAGVTLTQDGEPGSGRTSVRIRGFASFNKTDPLLVIDGIPTEGSIDNVNPNDIETIQVLKDASASIYGSRSAGGVIIITTKKGTKGKMNVDGGMIFGIQTLARKIETLDATQWGQVYWKAAKNNDPKATPQFTGYFDLNGNPRIAPDPQTYDLTDRDQTYQYTPKGTNWTDQVYQQGLDAKQQQYYLNISNGSDKGTVMFGSSYMNQTGLVKTSFYDRYTARLNSTYNLTKWLNVGENLSLTYTNKLGVTSQTDQGGVPFDAIRQHPLLPVYDVNGNYAGRVGAFPDIRNTVSTLQRSKNNTTDGVRIFGNVSASAEFFEAFKILNPKHKLRYTTNLGVDYNNSKSRNLQTKLHEGVYQIDVNNYAESNNISNTITLNNLLEYTYEGKFHNIKVLGGIETVQNTTSSLFASRSGLSSETPSYVTVGTGEVGTSLADGGRSSWGLYSQFARFDYSILNRYFVSGIYRHDKTSRFFTGGAFPTVMFAWKLSNEPFLAKYLSEKGIDVKLRFSYGSQGNQNTLGNLYAAYSTFGPNVNNSNYDLNGTNTSILQGFAIIARGNPALVWETTTQSDLGADIDLFNGKLNLTFDYYNKTSKDIIGNPGLIYASGEGIAPYVNVGKLQNKGFDLSLTHNYNSGKDFSISTTLQVSHYDNKILSLSSPTYPTGYEGEKYTNVDGARVAEGHAIGEFYGYISDGIFQNQAQVDAHAAQIGKGVGRLIYRDVNGDGKVDANDRTYIGSPHPKATLSLNISPRYKGFYLDVFLYAVVGQKIFNSTRAVTDFAQNGAYNRRTEILNAWTPENTGATIPAVTLDDHGNDEIRTSTYFVEDGSFLRCRTIRLGYNIPEKILKGVKINVYAEVQNAFTVTKYQGVDPEVPQNNGPTGNGIGVDAGVYPLPRTYLLGLNFKL